MILKICSILVMWCIFSTHLFSQPMDLGRVGITIDSPIPGVSLLEDKERLSFQRTGFVFSDTISVNIPDDASNLGSVIQTTIESALAEPQKLAPLDLVTLSTFLLKNERIDDYKELLSKTIPFNPNSTHENMDAIIALASKNSRNVTGIKPLMMLENSNGTGFYFLYKSISGKAATIKPTFFLKTPLGLLICPNTLNSDPEIAALWNALVYEELKGVKRVRIDQE